MRTTLERTGELARITIDDGKVNAMSAEMLDEIRARLAEAGDGARVTILAGRPGIFSAGFDMPTFTRGLEPARRMLEAGMRTIVAMLTHPHPIVTACAGHAFPMGAFLMLSADVRYGVRGPYKIGMNEVAIGLTVPEFALTLAEHRLNRTGFARVASGRMFTPDEAVAAGYLDHVVAGEDLEGCVDAAANDLLSLDLGAYAATKARMNGALAERISAMAQRARLEAELHALAG